MRVQSRVMSPSKSSSNAFRATHSPSGSLDFDDPEPNSPTFDMPSQHSGFRSSSVLDMESEPESTDSNGPWSPPVDWRKSGNGFFPRMAGSGYRSPTYSRQSSPLRGVDPDVTLAAQVPIPASPEKGRSPSLSPEPKTLSSVIVPAEDVEEANNNCMFYRACRVVRVVFNTDPDIRFAVRAEVQHRTEPIEALIKYWRHMTKSWLSILFYVASIITAIILYQKLVKSPIPSPGPDLIKVASLARGFEPMIHYSENGVAQIGELQETGVAVWDLGESVRQSNMTSAPIIVAELDDLSAGLKTLAIEMTKFFATVDGDIDSILIVIEWARRELSQISHQAPSSISSAIENLSSLARSAGGPDFSPYVHDLLGMTHADISKATLSRTFHEFLAVLEDSINGELKHSIILVGQFEAADRQFQNLQRSVARETNSQEALQDAELATLWRKLLGNCRFCSSDARLRKYQKNQELLKSVRERTVQNKLAVVEHNGRLQALRANLDQLRQRIVSPLVRSENGSTVSLADQIAGLEGTYEFLKVSREQQKSRNMERLYGSKDRRAIGK